MSTTVSYSVVGMTCNGCVNKVTKAVTTIEGVEDVDVDVSTGTLEVVGPADPAAVRAAVNEVGYKIVGD
jgi:copper chaperone